MSARRPRFIPGLLWTLAALIAVAGLLATLGTWAIMATYPDDTPNTWLQKAGPALVYLLPSWLCAFGLGVAARRLGGP